MTSAMFNSTAMLIAKTETLSAQVRAMRTICILFKS